MLTKASALEYAPFGIRVNAVAPAITETNLFWYSGLNRFEYEGFKSWAEENNPLKWLALPEEIGKAIVFLTSDKAETITGHVLTVSGGRHIAPHGYRDWYGSEKMDWWFEPTNSGLRKTWINIKQALFVRAPWGTPGSDAWCQWKQRSNWATVSNEAHEKQKLDYQAYNDRTDELAELTRQNQYGGMYNPVPATLNQRPF